MRPLLLLVLITTACASSAPHATTPAPASNGPLTGDEMMGMADEMCACGKDDVCATKVSDRLLATDGRGYASDADHAIASAAIDRARECYAPHLMRISHRTFVDIGKRTADTVCACKDVACAVEAGVAGTEAIGKVQTVHDDSPEHAELDAAFAREHARGAACYARLPGAGDTVAAVARYARFADEVCACAGDQACMAQRVSALRSEKLDIGALVFSDTHAVEAAVTRAVGCGWQPQ